MELTLEQRMNKLETELELLKARIENGGSKKDWISKITGTFKDDPVFEEIIRLGKEIRDAEEYVPE